MLNLPTEDPGRADSIAPRRHAKGSANRKNMILLIQLRWIAVIGQIVTIAAVRLGLGIELPLLPMAIVVAVEIGLNLASFVWLGGRTSVSGRVLLTALILDVAALSAQLWLSGGDTNPFTFLFLVQVTLAAVLLDRRSTWIMVVVTCASFTGLAATYQPLALPTDAVASLFALHIAGMLVCFVLDAALLVVFVTRITSNLRESDADLAALKQRAVEEDHIVRLGLLATGAAHELGTPLASLSVILGDWHRMRAIADDPDMTQEVEEMQAAVQRCKAIVTDILLSAGEARGEAPEVTSVNVFLDEIVGEWHDGRIAAGLTFENHFGTDLPIVSDVVLKQVVFNVLDNAYDVSPDRIAVTATRADEALVLRVSDAGPGFTPDALEHFGRPYNSSKGRPGGGLGLFLVVNVVRKLGGAVSVRNGQRRGAVVTLTLPLATLAMGAPAHAG